ncbi:hypothetical protein MTO96_041828, partial [Rhipicephalus appendiculatus]
MSSNPPPSQTTSSDEPQPHRPAACELGSPGAVPAQDKAQPLSGPEPTAPLEASRENNSTTSSFTSHQRQKRRKRCLVSSGASSGRSRRSREDSNSSSAGGATSRDSRRHSAPPGDIIWTMDTQPDWLPAAHPSDVAATETRRKSAAGAVASQPPTGRSAVRRFSMQLNAAAASAIKPSLDEPHQPSEAPVGKAASIAKHTATQSSASETAAGGACLRTAATGHSSSMSEGSGPRKSSMAQRRSLDRWSARKMEDQAP